MSTYNPVPISQLNMAGGPVTPVASDPNSFWSFNAALGQQTQNGFQQGWLPSAVQGLGGLAQSWLGFQQLNLAKDQFAFQKDAFTQQYNQQANDLNRRLEDRQRARLSANPTAYQSVGDYMSQYGAKPYGG